MSVSGEYTTPNIPRNELTSILDASSKSLSVVSTTGVVSSFWSFAIGEALPFPLSTAYENVSYDILNKYCLGHTDSVGASSSV